MDLRHAKALEIADKFRITESHGRWTVPSQSGAGKYCVTIMDRVAKCTCPDFETRRLHCKHILAVQYLIERQQNPDGTTTVTETLTVSKRTTYPQNWPAYNEAQTKEQDLFLTLLHDLCRPIPTPPQEGRGRRTLPLADMIFCAAYKVYSTFSGRRFMSELRESQRCGYIAHTPHYNSIFNYLENECLTPVLMDLIIQSSLPLKAVEQDFACDSSGFGVGRFFRWYDHKYGQEHLRQDWLKVHIMCGVKTNIVTAVEIRERSANDSPLLPPLVRTTAKNFHTAEVSADKAYACNRNTNAIRKVHAMPFIAIKSNQTAGGGPGWREMYYFFMYKRDEFLTH